MLHQGRCGAAVLDVRVRDLGSKRSFLMVAHREQQVIRRRGPKGSSGGVSLKEGGVAQLRARTLRTIAIHNGFEFAGRLVLKSWSVGQPDQPVSRLQDGVSHEE